MNYVLEAISRDGRYFILVFADIVDLQPPAEWEAILRQSENVVLPSKIGPERYKAIENANQESERRLPQLVNTHLAEAPPESFEPDLRQIDAAVRTLELR